MQIEIRIGDQWGLDVNQIKAIIEQYYVSPTGNRVAVEYGDGVILPYSYLQIKDKT